MLDSYIQDRQTPKLYLCRLPEIERLKSGVAQDTLVRDPVSSRHRPSRVHPIPSIGLLRPPDDDFAHMHAGEVLERATIWEIDSAQGVPYSADSWETITGWLVLFRGVAEVD